MIIYYFEIIFVILITIFFLSTLFLIIRKILNQNSKEIGKVVLNAVISLLLGLGLLFGIIIFSLVAQFFDISSDYGISFGLVIAPFAAIGMQLYLNFSKVNS